MGNQKPGKALAFATSLFLFLTVQNPLASGDVQVGNPSTEQSQGVGQVESQEHGPEQPSPLEKIHTFPTVENNLNSTSPNPNAISAAGANAGVFNSATNPPLMYMGGAPAGVTTTTPKVYLVFWGSQWGTPSLTADGYVQYSNDWAGVAPYIQKFIAGIGSNNESWSSVVTQYCVGVAKGATSCNPTDPHILYPSENVLGGVWNDASVAAPAYATQAQIAAEAEAAATFFGKTTTQANANSQYFIISPSGTHPDNFNSPLNWCAWHSYTSGKGGLAYTNLPYLPDVGASCGAGYINSGNILDGISIVGGHEYLETLTDQVPYTGWMDSLYYENGDECSWIKDPRASGNLTLSTGTFAVQGTYSNDTASCEMTHQKILTSDLRFTTSQLTATTVGANYQVQMSASGGTAPYSFAAINLPTGLIMNSSGLISGVSTTPGSYIVTLALSDSSSPKAILSKNFTLQVNTQPKITNTSLSQGTYNTAYSATISATGGSSPYLFSATGLPTGLNIVNSTGLISGIPTQIGTQLVNLKVTDAVGVVMSLDLNLVINSAPGLNSAFSTPITNSTGFTTSITNYDSTFSYTFSATVGTVQIGTATSNTLPITITGLSAGQSSIVTAVTNKYGYLSGNSSVTGAALNSTAGLVSTFSTPISNSTGFTVNITNYNSLYTYTFKLSSGTLKKGTASGANLPLTVSGLTAGSSSTIKVTTSRSGYSSASASVTGSATALLPALIPVTSSPVSTSGGFIFAVTNYDPTFNFTATSSSGKLSVVSTVGNTRNYSVTGLKAGASATVTVKTTKSGYATGSSTVTGKSL